MSEKYIPPRGESPEIGEPTISQLKLIETMASEIVDGAVDVAGTDLYLFADNGNLSFNVSYYRAARYDHATSSFRPATETEMNEALADPSNNLDEGVFNMEHNIMRLTIRRTDEIVQGHDLTIESSLDENYMHHIFTTSNEDWDQRYEESQKRQFGFNALLDHQAQQATRVINLLVQQDVEMHDGQTVPVNVDSSELTSETHALFAMFTEADLLDTSQKLPDPDVAARINDSLASLLQKAPTRANFTRKNEDIEPEHGVSVGVQMAAGVVISNSIEVVTITSSGDPELDQYKAQYTRDWNGEMRYRHFLDFDVGKLILEIIEDEADNLESSESLDIVEIIDQRYKKVKRQREIYETERDQGFHNFSHADATEVIETLQRIINESAG
jgi:hypothetical protein